MASSIVLSDNGVTSGSAGIKSQGGNDGVLLLQTTTAGGSATTAVTVDNAQNVGIGTSSPTAYTTRFIEVSNATSSGLKLTATSGNALGAAVEFIASDKSMRIGTYESTAYIQFRTQDTERARIDSSGNLLVGKTSASDTSVGFDIRPTGRITTTATFNTNTDTTYHAYSTNQAAYRFYIGWGGTVYATNTTITAISDQRLKENIRDLDDGLEKVMALQPRKFDWKEGKGADIKNARGFIAQEFETVFPDMIDEWKDPAPEGEESYKAINANLIPTLVKAIQEQQALIQSLTDRLTALEGAAK